MISVVLGLIMSMPSSYAVKSTAESAVSHNKNEAQGCERVLNGSGQNLSPAGQAYMNLIQFYMNKNGQRLSGKFINKIVSAKQPVNPFKSEMDAFSKTVSAGFERALKSLSSLSASELKNEWAQIRLAVQGLIKASNESARDRENKKEETRRILLPQLIDKKATRDDIHSSPAVQVVDWWVS